MGKQNQCKEFLSQQKHAIQIVNNKMCFEHTKELNILNIVTFIHKVYNKTTPATFFELFQKSLILIQQGFQNCAARYLKQILLNVNTEFQVEDC